MKRADGDLDFLQCRKLLGFTPLTSEEADSLMDHLPEESLSDEEIENAMSYVLSREIQDGQCD